MWVSKLDEFCDAVSLAAAVLEIADEMEQEVASNGDSVRSWAKQLRRAVKAAEGAPDVVGRAIASVMPPGARQDREMTLAEIEAKHRRDAVEYIRDLKAKQAAAQEEAVGAEQVVIVDGPLEGTTVPLRAGAPIGAKIGPLEGVVYVLGEDRKLHAQ